MEAKEDFHSIGDTDDISETGFMPTTQNLVPPGPSTDSDSRTGWIYLLKKSELAAQLTRFGLCNTGTLEEMRRRIVKFIRDGHSSPQPRTQPFDFSGNGATIPTVSTIATLTTTTVTTTVSTTRPTPTAQNAMSAATMFDYNLPLDTGITPAPVMSAPMINNYPLLPNTGISHSYTSSPLNIRQWGVTYNGRSDPATFLERLEEICTAQNIQPDRLLPQLPEVLQGEAALWYRNNRGNYRNWEDFTREFRIFYYPVNYEVDLEAKISRRVQRTNESVIAYITDLQTLIRRHGNISPSQELQWLYRNLLPEYRQYVRRGDFHDISTFSQVTKEFELLRNELQQTSHRRVAFDNVPTDTVETRPNRESRRAVRTEDYPNTSNHTNVIQNQRTNQNGSRHMSTPPRRPLNAATSTSPATSNVICWRCGQTGHYRTDCTQKPQIFCSRCKTKGVLSRDCPCGRSGN